MDYKTAVRELEKGQARAVYLCYGPEKFLQQEFISLATDRLIASEHREFALIKYDLAETSLDIVLDDAETLPFLVPNKVIIAKNANFFTGAKESAKLEHNVDRLLAYLKSPVTTSVIIFVVDADKLDERKKLVKYMKEQDCTVPFLALAAEEVIRWVHRQAEKRGFTFGAEAAEQFILYAGANLPVLSTELDKMSLYIGKKGVVTSDMVEQLVVRSSEQNVFILIEEIVQMRLDRALSLLYELLKQREEPIKIIVLIARQFRMILQARDLEKQGYSQQQIASQIGAHPYAVKLALGQGRHYDQRKLSDLLARLAELDYRIKSGKVDKVLGLELFILQIPS